MRDIKFRCWRKNKNDMLHFTLAGAVRESSTVYEKGKFITGLGGGTSVSDAIKNNYPLMQYTGLKDKK